MFEQVISYYEGYDEDGRLLRDNTHKTEYLTTIRYFDRMICANSKILDACSGTGRYAFYLADKGHRVTACDLTEHNISIIKSKPDAAKLNDISVCNVLDLSRFEDNSFDVVLCMGALYHLKSTEQKKQAMSECIRVCKPNGIAVFAYITKNGAVHANINHDTSNMDELLSTLYNGVGEEIFICVKPHEIESLAADCGFERLCNIGTDGISFAIRDRLNSASDENFQKYMAFHYSICEDESILGMSLHGLYFGRKPSE